jgi:4-hydroxyphenylpyruvate dioxygenase
LAQQVAPSTGLTPVPDHDFMPLNGIHHVELYVGNALQAAYYFAHAFGFKRVAYRGLETGTRDHVSHVLQQGRIRLVLTGALDSSSPIAAHQHKHGDGVKVIALSVPDVEHAYREATSRGAESVAEPHETSDDHGAVKLATIKTYGETLHTFVERDGYDGAFLPGFEPIDDGTEDSGMLLAIDHIVGNVELGSMETWVKFYEDVFGMTEMIHFSDDDISTEYSALMSKVVSDGKGLVKFPINEPAEGKRKSQIDEYLEFYEGAGAQHIAVATRDIVGTVAEMRRRGVECHTIPPA